MADLIYKDEVYQIVGCCYEVHKNLGCGFLEAVYQEALSVEFKTSGIPFQKEKVLDISYKGQLLEKKYVADFICFDKIILELKAMDTLADNHISQVLNYLKATNLRLGLLINFGQTSLVYKRIVL
jgi:GxxExxY protein